MRTKKYFFSDYNGNCGEQRLFDVKEEALVHAAQAWHHLTKKEREKMEWCFVDEVELTEEEVERFHDGDMADAFELHARTIWSMGKGVKDAWAKN